MVGYILILIEIGIFGYFLCEKYISSNLFFTVITLSLTLFYGLRSDSVGSDTAGYISMFINDGSVSVSNIWTYMWVQKSPGYVFSEWIFYNIIPIPQLWLIATSLWFFKCLEIFIKKNTDRPIWAYFLFFTIFGTFQMTGMRQGVAMGFLLLAYEEIKRRHLVKYLVLIYIAFLFHQTALVFLPMYWFAMRKVRLWDVLLLIFAIVPIYLFRIIIFDFIKSFTSYYYFEILSHSEPINFSIMIYGATLFGIIMMRFNANHIDHTTKCTCESAASTMQHINIMYAAALFMPLVAVNGAIRRIVMYFAFFLILFVPKGLKIIFKDQLLNIVVQLFLILILSYFLLSGVAYSSYYYRICLFA